ncbi:hypothetical protein BD779DRAFT_1469470 [Infundibulicybe gibba]|nr:hypothetical protein BD779DRAFT_1469470 [Infundibulicybe gibba]
MIGRESERNKVIKLWDGFRPEIQGALYKERLNPETSSWKEVITTAEIIEISEEVSSKVRNSRRNRDKDRGSGTRNPSPSHTTRHQNIPRHKRRNYSPEGGRKGNPPGSSQASGTPSGFHHNRSSAAGTGNNQKDKGRDSQSLTKLTDKQRDEYRAEGRPYGPAVP